MSYTKVLQRKNSGFFVKSDNTAVLPSIMFFILIIIIIVVYVVYINNI